MAANLTLFLGLLNLIEIDRRAAVCNNVELYLFRANTGRRKWLSPLLLGDGEMDSYVRDVLVVGNSDLNPCRHNYTPSPLLDLISVWRETRVPDPYKRQTAGVFI